MALHKSFILLLLFFAITPNLGFFNISSFLLITIILISVFFLKYFPSEKENKSIVYILFALGFFSIIYYGGIYQTKNTITVGNYLLAIFITVNFLGYFILKKTLPFLVLIAFYLFLAYWTIVNSPKPTVDTFIVLKEAPIQMLGGQNPYAETFTEVYRGIIPNYYNYLPFSFFYAAPFVYFFSDPRYMIIFSNLLSAYLIYRIFYKDKHKQKLNLFIITFLFLPRSFYMLEHVYLDTVIFSFYLTFLYLQNKTKLDGLSFLFLSLFLSIKQPPVLTVPFLVKAYRKQIFKLKNILFFLIPFIFPVYYFLLDRKAFIEDIFLGLNPEKITSPIEYSLTLPTFFKSSLLLDSDIYLICLALFLIFYVLIFKSNFSIVFKITLFFLSFNYFTYHAFFNSYYLVAQFLLLEIMRDYFKLKLEN